MSHIRNMLMSQVAGMESLSAADASQVEEIAEKTAEEVAELVADKAAEEVKEEVNDLADEVEEVSEAIEEIEEDVEELEECVEGLESLLQAGSYNAAAFGILYNRAEKIHRKLGGKDTGAVVGAEALGDATSAGLAARSGLEGFTETMKQYKDSAVKFIMSMYEAAKNFVKGLLDKSVAIENQVKATKARLDKAEELKKDVKPGKWASLAKITDTSKIERLITSADAVVSAAQKLSTNDVAGYASAYGNLKSAVEGLASTGDSNKSKSGDKETHQIKVGAVMITASVYTGEIKEQADVSKAAKATSLSFSADKSGDVKFEALDKSKASAYLTEAGKAGKRLSELKESKSGNEKGRDELVAAIKKLDGKEEEWVKPAINAVKASTAMTNKIFTVGARILGNVADAKLAAVKAYL
ncbi:hypothetical protein [Vibrio phage 2 TSL-2019]|uniref:Uncharacterized protein n=1 Tax=Vibrio phage 2 TSL-2019 TaxID=2508172 RepID=A0A513PWJ2_9CAUD|nr:internal head protein [Vibrio phage 2 TSL-2019]QAU04324.1 hypothetical protein [Vibrio phage 2 TSL-2019]